MKKSLLFLFVLMLSAAALFAQAPQKMSYQAVVRNANNTLVTSQNVSARVSILQGSVNGTPVYVEIHNATTNANGLLTLEVGGGSTVVGSLAAVDWANGPFFLKSEIDPNGGVNYSIEGTQQLMSVPYALYAEKAGNVPAFGITPVDSGYVIAVTQPGGTPQTYFLPTGGGQGPAGNDGLSAYQLWLNAGNTGSEADFLASLVGTPGNDGQDGVGIDSIAKTGTADNVDTYTIYYSNNTTSTYTVTNGVDGAPGTPGDPGTPGAPGDPGFSPTITVDTGAAGMVLTITDVNGSNQYIIPNGGGSGSGGTIVQQQVNWNETNPASVSYILNKPSLATVATSGSYNDLLDKPAIPTNISQLNNDAGFVTTASVPTLNVTQTDTGYVLTITENGSTQTYILRDGRDGQDGQDGNDGNDGEDGNDGVSPTITLDTAGSNLMVTITDANGSNTTIIPLSSGSGTFTQLPADWNATSGVQQILHKPTLATVATSGNYNDLTNKPTIPAEQVQANWNETNTSSKAYIQNKPVLADVATSGDYDDLDNKPTLSTVATTGSYNDLTNKPTIPAEQVQANWNETNTSSKAYIQNKPTIPAAQVNADWNATSGVAQIMNKPVLADVATSGDYDDLDNKPTLATVATSGDYDDLDNKPTIPAEQVQANWNETNTSSKAYIQNKPTIPAAQVNADWNATSGVAQIMNKPDIAGMQNAMDSLADALDNLHESMGFICGKDKVKDIDGNEYNTVKIGQQCWMKENLRTTKYPNGTEIPIGTDSSSTIGTRNAPGSEDNVATRGYLYNWVATMNGATSSGTNPSGVQGICPDGWHVPSNKEFTQLVEYVRGVDGNVCGSYLNNIAKALAATTLWHSSSIECAIGNDLSGNNATGFSAVPTGYYGLNFSGHVGQWYYDFQNNSTYYWTTEEHTNPAYIYTVSFGYSSTSITQTNYDRYKNAYSVRCLRDPENSLIQDVIDNIVSPLQNTIDSLQNTINESFDNLQESLGFICGVNTVKDYDENVYATIKIGEQCWMKENLRTTHYSDGTEIPLGTDTSRTNGYRYYPSKSAEFVSEYGYLYNWAALMNGSASSSATPSGVQGVCPTGWHVPSPNEWTQLRTYMQSQNQYRCNGTSANIAKALADKTGWNPVNSNTNSSCAIGVNFEDNNASGFGARGAGWLSDNGNSYAPVGGSALFCTSNSTSHSTYGTVYFVYGFFNSDTTLKSWANPVWRGHSVRCLRDPETPAPTGLTPEDVQNMINNAIAPLQNQINQQQNTIDSLNAALSLSTCGLYTVKDYDNNIYQTVRIGNQCWLRENMRAKHFSDGTAIIHGLDSSSTAFYYYYPNNDSTIVNSYGLLYNWPATMHGESFSNANPSGRQGVCPVGWHVPSSSEWVQLRNYLSNNSDYVCGDTNINVGKALAATTGWVSNTTNCTAGYQMETNNATGFSALPAGFYGISTTGGSNFGQFGNQACFWTSSWPGAGSYRNVYTIYSYFKILGGPTSGRIYESFSVRCLKD